MGAIIARSSDLHQKQALATRPADYKTSQSAADASADALTGWNKPRERVEQAFARDEFVLYQQRIQPLSGAAGPDFMELLVRHADEEANLTPPGAFLPVLEHYNMMSDLDRWVIRRVLRWHAAHAGARSMVFSINADPQTLTDGELPEYVEEHLAVYDVPASSLCFEMPLNHLTEHLSRVLPVARALKTLGCRVAIGGVGRNPVSFKPIRDVQADFVKIDGSLVLRLNRDAQARAKVNAISRVCRANGMQTVAEFVEESETIERLKSMGIDYAQGFGISRPAPLVELEQQ